MRFQTEVELPAGCQGMISHGARILTLGSCFADEVGNRLFADLFDIEVNPFGPLFNPASIARAVQIIADSGYDPSERIVGRDGRWFCVDFHSRLWGDSPQSCIDSVFSVLSRLREWLRGLDVVFLTLGSANVYVHRRLGPVANCHKLPGSDFVLEDIGVARVAQLLAQAVRQLRDCFNPSMKVVVTISPVRHGGHTFHADRLSKARLLLGADGFAASTEGVFYFPAYEIVQDQLRDYRFYAADMKHPSGVAVDFVYEQLERCFFRPGTAALAAECRKVTTRLAHRPIVVTDAYYAELRQAVENFRIHHPDIAPALNRYIATNNIRL